MWNPATGGEQWSFDYVSVVTSVAFAIDGKTLVCGGGNWVRQANGKQKLREMQGEILLLSTTTGKQEGALRGHHGSVSAMNFPATVSCCIRARRTVRQSSGTSRGGRSFIHASVRQCRPSRVGLMAGRILPIPCALQCHRLARWTLTFAATGTADEIPNATALCRG